MRGVFFVFVVSLVVTLFSGCLKTTSYKPVPAPAGLTWGMERDALSQSTLVGSSHQEKSSYDNKTYNVYVTKMSQAQGESYNAQGTYDAIKTLCPEPGKGKCQAKRLPYRPLSELPR